jgi:hypothetical protein
VHACLGLKKEKRGGVERWGRERRRRTLATLCYCCLHCSCLLPCPGL